MKPAVMVSLTLLCLVYVGNACMKSGFKADVVNDDSNKFSTCAADEASLNRSFLADAQIGYIGEDRVSYSPYDDSNVIIHGDMIVPADGGRLPSKPAPAGISQGVGAKLGALWANGRIPYKIPLNFPNRSRIDAAIAHWNTKLSGVIELVPWSNETHFASFKEIANGCAAVVGFQSLGAHEISISSACSEGNIIHEIGHIIGLQHEQNRLDRDSFVSINWAKIQDGYAPNFETDAVRYKNYRSYDFGSIMHYFLSQFSKDGSNTIVPKVSIPADIVVGQRVQLSRGDINSVREMYGFPPLDGVEEPVLPPSGVAGIAGSYYQTLDFQDLRASQLDQAIDFEWGIESPQAKISGTNFSVRWRGWLIPEVTGDYQFEIVSSGAFKVMMDATTVFENKKNRQKNSFVSRYYNLNSGQKIRIVVDYVAMSSENSIKLRWIKPDGTEEVVPASQMVADDSAIKELENLCTVVN